MRRLYLILAIAGVLAAGVLVGGKLPHAAGQAVAPPAVSTMPSAGAPSITPPLYYYPPVRWQIQSVPIPGSTEFATILLDTETGNTYWLHYEEGKLLWESISR